MTTKKLITQPPEWWTAFETQAKNDGLTLSAWVGECCRANLRPSDAKQLPERRPPGATPKKETK